MGVGCTRVCYEVLLILQVCRYTCALNVLHTCCKCDRRGIHVCASVLRVLCLGCEEHVRVVCVCGMSAGTVCVTCAMFTDACVWEPLQWAPLQASVTHWSQFVWDFPD